MGGEDKNFRVISFTWNVIPADMLDYAVSNYSLSAEGGQPYLSKGQIYTYTIL